MVSGSDCAARQCLQELADTENKKPGALQLRVSDEVFEEDLCGLLAVVLVLDFFIVGIDDVAIAGCIGLCIGIGSFGLLRFVHRLTKLHRGFEKRLGLGLDVFGIRL